MPDIYYVCEDCGKVFYTIEEIDYCNCGGEIVAKTIGYMLLISNNDNKKFR